MTFSFAPTGTFSQQTLSGIPEGLIPFVLANSLGDKAIIHICEHENRLLLLEDQLKSLLPPEDILIFPPWDCLPYDRVSPKKDSVGKRLETLMALLEHKKTFCLLTTPLAFVQRLMPKNLLKEAFFHIKKEHVFDARAFKVYMQSHGYRRVETVREPGEFATRGSIIDLFPSQSDTPIRMDLFGDQVESIRTFDALTQRSLDFLETFSLLPAQEIVLNPETIKNFREGYRKIAGSTLEKDALYQSICEGKAFPGMDHWLPLFYGDCSTLVDYMPASFHVSLEHQTKQALFSCLNEIDDYYQSRERAPKKWGEPPYHPVPVSMFYQTIHEIETLFNKTKWQDYSPYSSGRDTKEFKAAFHFSTLRQKNKSPIIDELIQYIKDNPKPHIIACASQGSLDRLKSLLTQHGWPRLQVFDTIQEALKELPRLSLVVFPLQEGFEGSIILLSENNIFGPKNRRQKRKRHADLFLQETSSLTTHDLVVHSHHGIGRYEGLETLNIETILHDCVCLSYDGGDKLYVPVENLDLLSRYKGDSSLVPLDKLGTAHWQARRARIKKRLMDIADHLISLAAKRQLNKIQPFLWDASEYDAFSASFPFTETDDQLQAIHESLEDLKKDIPMDRLICGDVGFGKTEVAMRAAFAAACAGYQVALVAPTTLLSRQHYGSFQKRFSPFGLKVAHLSRLVSPKDVALSKKAIEAGEVDVVIGTHGLLKGTTKFKNLGLVIVDEEQHFGVKQKEKLKESYPHVHLLTLSATPIPRTLQMALSGVRDLSLITTPPMDRLAVRTYVMAFDGVTIREAIMREIYRGGQLFMVCPHVEDLNTMEERLRLLVPEIRFVTVHGQLPASNIEEIMLDFCDHKYDLMLSTNIIESGLDLPKVNTIIIHRADHFGLAQLYQLRGRVGRAKVRGYAYMTYGDKKLTSTAEKRLEVIQGLDTLGAGFQIASHDMDIRGAGNLLGSEQSGHIKEIGSELYQHMLEEALASVQHPDEVTQTFMPVIHLSLPVLIPVDYIPSLSLRLELYRRLSNVKTFDELLDLKEEMIDRFGPLPETCENLIDVLDLKILCRKTYIDKIDVGPKGATISFHDNSFPNTTGLIDFIKESKGVMRLKSDHRLSYLHTWKDTMDQKQTLKKLLEALAKLID